MNKPVSLELAQLLKKENFSVLTGNCYFNNEFFTNQNLISLSYPELKGENYKEKVIDKLVFAPTIADVVMWIWNTYKVWIVVWSDTNLDLPDWRDKAKWFYVLNCDLLAAYESGTSVLKYTFDTIEEAYEAGIEYVLKNKQL